MRLKKSKEDVLNDIWLEIYQNQLHINQLNSDPHSVLGRIDDHIKSCVMKGFQSLLANSYTDEDFNSDLEKTLSE